MSDDALPLVSPHERPTSPDRRALLTVVASIPVAGLVPRVQAQSSEAAVQPQSDLTGRVARYMAAAWQRELPVRTVADTKARILDTLAAIVSGSTLPPGLMGERFARSQGGPGEATIVASGFRTTAINAAFANGMAAHADETDDFDPVTKAHPGCAVLPAALAFAERHDRSGQDLIRGVALGYDLCCRLLLALDPDLVRGSHRSAEGTGATIGATAAAASLARLDEIRMRYALSYAGQQTSGLWSWERDHDHIEKAFDFSAMGSRNGAYAVSMVEAGFTGVSDVLDGANSMISALSSAPRAELMAAELGTRHYVSETAIKVFSVGYPIQAPLDAVLTLRTQNGLRPDLIREVVVHLPADGANIVNSSAMPDVNLQHLVAVALIDGTVSFEASHSRERMSDPAVLALRQRVRLVADPALVDRTAPRSALVEVVTTDGRMLRHFTKHPPGSMQNPLGAERVNEKARRLMSPVIGAARAEKVIRTVASLDTLPKVSSLVAILAGRSPS